MAVRTPLKILNPSGPVDIWEMSNTDIENVHTNADDVYRSFPATTLSVVGSGGNLSGLPMTDTRYQAGASTTRVDRFATEAETANISIVTVNYSRILQSIFNGSLPPDTSNLAWPLYLTPAGDFQAMTSTDFYDTFVAPALARIAASTDPIGEYFISTSPTAAANAQVVSATPVFTDTRADVAAYTSGGIPETQDQPTTINNYYLHQYTGTVLEDEGLMPLMFDAGTEQIFEPGIPEWRLILGPWLQYYKAQAGSTVTYNINGAGTTQGTVMLNTILSPTGTGYTQRYVGLDDYRTQEFPNGTPVTANTYELRKTTV
jgi:hypothetical protein